MWPRSNLHSRPEISGDPYNPVFGREWYQTNFYRLPPILFRMRRLTSAAKAAALRIAVLILGSVTSHLPR